MAASNSIELPGLPPLRFRKDSDSTSYFGTREQFLAARLIDHETLLPGDPGLSKGFVKYEDHPLRVHRVWQRRPGWFTLEVMKDPAEIARMEAEHTALEERWKLEREEREAQRKLQETLREAAEAGMEPEEWVLRRTAKTADDFRRWRLRILETQVELLLEPAIETGFSFDAATNRRIGMLFQSIAELMRTANVNLDQKAFDRHRSKVLEESGLLRHVLAPLSPARPALSLAYSRDQAR